jgi:electron transfer flavoprotein alpha subunit
MTMIMMMRSASRSFRLASIVSSAASRYASTLIVADAGLASTQSAVTAAAMLGGDHMDLLVVGDAPPTQIPAGITTTHFLKTTSKLAETTAAAIHHLAKDYSHVVAAHTKFGSNVLPRASAMLGVAPVTDVLTIESNGKAF